MFSCSYDSNFSNPLLDENNFNDDVFDNGSDESHFDDHDDDDIFNKENRKRNSSMTLLKPSFFNSLQRTSSPLRTIPKKQKTPQFLTPLKQAFTHLGIVIGMAAAFEINPAGDPYSQTSALSLNKNDLLNNLNPLFFLHNLGEVNKQIDIFSSRFNGNKIDPSEHADEYCKQLNRIGIQLDCIKDVSENDQGSLLIKIYGKNRPKINSFLSSLDNLMAKCNNMRNSFERYQTTEVTQSKLYHY